MAEIIKQGGKRTDMIAKFEKKYPGANTVAFKDYINFCILLGYLKKGAYGNLVPIDKNTRETRHGFDSDTE